MPVFMLRSDNDKASLIEKITNVDLSKKNYRVEIKQHKNRSLEANNLYWQWLTLLAGRFSNKDKKFCKDDIHDLVRHMFLGYDNKIIGKTEILPQLKSTADLSKRS